MPRRRLKIAIFHFGFFYSGGGERLVLEEAIGLEKLGHDVTLYAPVVDKKNCFPELISQVKVQKILPKILPAWFPDNTLLSILSVCILIPFFFFKFRKFDIYFGANQPGPWISYLLSKINGKPYFIYLAQPTRLIHPRFIDQQVGLKLRDGFSMLNIMTILLKPFIYLTDVISIRNANAVFANGSYMSGVLAQIYRIKTINCPAGTKIKRENEINDRFTGSVRLNDIKIRKPYILITNRHYPQKKFEYAIEAVSLLDKNIPLVITGQSTDYTGKLKKQFSGNKNLYFTGLLSEEDLEKAYSQAAVYVYPAPEEDFGMGIIEAMSYGTPVVAWGNAGPTGIIMHEIDSLLAMPFDVADFSKQIQRLLADKTFYLKIARNSIKKISKSFTFQNHAKFLHNYFLDTAIKGMRKDLNINSDKNLVREKGVLQFQFEES